jgi:hypothetical protein
MDTRTSLALFAGITWLLSFGAHAGGTDKPPIPYLDHGACPFECCTYREWTAAKETVLRKDFNDSAPVVTTIKQGEKVQGLTGVVITTKPGPVKILKTQKLRREKDEKEVTLQPGDVIYNLHYVGAGFDKFWFRGELLVDQTNIRKIEKNEWWEITDLPTWVWWAKVKRSNGDVGWTKELKNFRHIDACE